MVVKMKKTMEASLKKKVLVVRRILKGFKLHFLKIKLKQAKF